MQKAEKLGKKARTSRNEMQNVSKERSRHDQVITRGDAVGARDREVSAREAVLRNAYLALGHQKNISII